VRDLVRILWSKGIALHCDHRWAENYWRLPTEHRTGAEYFRRHWNGCRGLTYVRLGTPRVFGSFDDSLDLVHFAANLDALTHPVVLLTTDGCTSIPGELLPRAARRILDHPLILAWYTQNWDGTPHPKLHPFPIGCDFHGERFELIPGVRSFKLLRNLTRRLNGMLRGLPGSSLLRLAAASAPAIAQRELRVFCDAHLRPWSRHNNERERIQRRLDGCPTISFLGSRVSQWRIWDLYSRHAFVLSPHGVGLDCHRTWEVLALGGIAIVKTSSLDPLYRGLAVKIVEDWDECRDPGALARWREELETPCADAFVRLEPARWVAPLREILEEASGHSDDRRRRDVVRN